MSPELKDLTASSLLLRTYWLIAVLQFAASWLFGLFSLAQYPSEARLLVEIQGQKKSIERRLTEGGAYWQTLFQPEGMIFSYAFYSYGLIGLTLRLPQETAIRQDVLRQLETLIPKAERAIDEYPFNYNSNIKPRGGVIAAGNANLMRAGYVLIGGKKQDVIDAFHRGSDELAKSFEESKWPLLSSFEFMHERWPVDNVCAVESLRLHDKIYGTKYMTSARRLLSLIETDIDKENGMMNSGILEAGGRADVPRGCALSWSLSYIPAFLREFSEKQYALYRQNWFVPVIGTVGIHEWWPDEQKKYSTINEGPVVLGIGTAASGLGMVVTRVQGDRDAWLGLWRGLESVGFPSWNILGEKSYFGELFLLADTISFWSRTACVWDQPASLNSWSESREKGWSDLQLDQFWMPLSMSVVMPCWSEPLAGCG